ncbi:MAG: AAA family ATPase [Eubacteriales bacterium]|nr:AAA family ATPase [Eubacteriales bacterium]
MNDYPFGNQLYGFRCRAGLTQQEVADQVGVTNKAVSKWENGKTKPTLNVLRKLSVLYQISLEELLTMSEERKAQEITKIVITGGPCAGKTTAMSWIQNFFTEKGYTVLFIPETATELIGGGVAPWTCGSNEEYQKCQMLLQMKKEEIFMQAARSMENDRILVICDRGLLDNKAYMSDLEFSSVIRSLGCNEVEMRDKYDAVFHLTTAAKGALDAYTLANNAARTETPEQAAELDDKLIAAWTGHPHLRVIDNSTDFQTKMKCLIAEISAFLGIPEPLEIERKYLIEFPDITWLESLPNCQRIEIIQTYLAANINEEVRVRQRGIDGHYVYYKTTKRKINDLKRVEIEKRLTKDEYLACLMNADPFMHPVRKTRYCLTEANRYYEIDVFPFWKDQAIVEIELSSENEEIVLPKQLKIIREVTEDEAFKNASLARKEPDVNHGYY